MISDFREWSRFMQDRSIVNQFQGLHLIRPQVYCSQCSIMDKQTTTLHVIQDGVNDWSDFWIVVGRNDIAKLGSQTQLRHYLIDNAPHQSRFYMNPSEDSLARYSKRNQSYIPLDLEASLSELRRCLKVKKVVKLMVKTGARNMLPARGNNSLLAIEANTQVRSVKPNAIERSLPKISEALRDSHQLKKVERSKCDSKSLTFNVICDLCYAQGKPGNVDGLRYKCLICQDFDLCSRCFNKNLFCQGHEPTHPMVTSYDCISLSTSLERIKVGLEGCGTGLCSSVNHIVTVDEHEKVPAFKAQENFVDTLHSKSQQDIEDTGKTLHEEHHMNSDLTDLTSLQFEIRPIGKSLLRLSIRNEGRNALDLYRKKLHVFNCFQNVVATVNINKNYPLLPGRKWNFNVVLNNTHLKYPFVIEMRGETQICRVGLSFDKPKNTVIIRDKTACQYQEEESLGSQRIYLAPQLAPTPGAKAGEAVGDLAVSAAAEMERISNESEIDFDLVGFSEGDDSFSDYDMLSSVNSYST